jgi:hypothetical protein
MTRIGDLVATQQCLGHHGRKQGYISVKGLLFTRLLYYLNELGEKGPLEAIGALRGG